MYSILIMTMKNINLEKMKRQVREELKKIQDVKSLEHLKIKYLGRKRGLLTSVLRALKDLPLAQKREIGPKANALKNEIESAITKKFQDLKLLSAQRSTVDVTMPGKKIRAGHLHPLTKIEQKVRDIFRGLNFSVVEGPEVETEYHNFDALNIPHDHPARDMWDTFWLSRKESAKEGANLLMRTHTSPMQIRYMKKHNPPFQIIVPGRVFRYEATDASHEINFYQVEGLMVGEDISLSNFKYIIEQFFRQLFGNKTEIRFRPSYFPFVEPGLEVDIKLNTKSPSLNASWLEVMGAGMVHPNVFKAVGYNPKYVKGFAFGLGLERLAMIKYGIPDIRLFYSADLRFINQF